MSETFGVDMKDECTHKLCEQARYAVKQWDAYRALRNVALLVGAIVIAALGFFKVFWLANVMITVTMCIVIAIGLRREHHARVLLNIFGEQMEESMKALMGAPPPEMQKVIERAARRFMEDFGGPEGKKVYGFAVEMGKREDDEKKGPVN